MGLKLIALIKVSIKDGFAILNFTQGKTCFILSALSFENVLFIFALVDIQTLCNVRQNVESLVSKFLLTRVFTLQESGPIRGPSMWHEITPFKHNHSHYIFSQTFHITSHIMSRVYIHHQKMRKHLSERTLNKFSNTLLYYFWINMFEVCALCPLLFRSLLMTAGCWRHKTGL